MLRAHRLAAVILVAGCVETVPLGNECADQSEQCEATPAPVAPVEPAPRPTSTSTRSTRDAGTPTTPSAPPVDIAPAAEPMQPEAEPAQPELPLFPDLENRSFETLATGSLTSRTDDRTAPWVGCAIGWNVIGTAFITSLSGNGDEMVRPTEGSRFMEYVRPEASDPIAPLSQHLETPLEPGKRYALRMDAQVSADVPVSLEVWSGSRHDDAEASCRQRERLGDTGRIQAGGWRPVCVSFEAPTSSTLDELMVVANFDEASNSNVRVFIDNFRNDPPCP